MDEKKRIRSVEIEEIANGMEDLHPQKKKEKGVERGKESRRSGGEKKGGSSLEDIK